MHGTMKQWDDHFYKDYFKTHVEGKSRAGQAERKEGDCWTCELLTLASFQTGGL